MQTDVEERMKILAINHQNEEDEGDTFAERAESYYRKRPQLLALLQDLYNAYLTLSDKLYSQSSNPNNKSGHHRRHSSQVSDYYYDTTVTDIESDLESSLSYQQPMMGVISYDQNPSDDVIAELVMKNVELEVVMEELGRSERRCSESSRKIELQRSLLEVLESERLVLLNENARLEYKAAALAEENKGLASESMFMRRRAGELARCVLKMREDQRVCMLSRDRFMGWRRGTETTTMMKKLNQISLILKRNQSQSGSNIVGKKGWWERVKSMDLFLCGVNPSSSA
ncbi:hypothetical protein L484_025091 [Morus notabilis]|uniref:NAB domain-containing protein n=1 Tax=Morus notabilis TaxID=981085 RepID=W9RL22_9ROSA|nr:hypothetical protein L484_025091 [Morus notabilis]